MSGERATERGTDASDTKQETRSVVLWGDHREIAPECTFCGSTMDVDPDDGAFLECPSGHYVFNAETGESYSRPHGEPTDRNSTEVNR